MLIFAVIILSGCKKLVEVDPPVTSVTGASVYTTDVTAISVLTGLFGNINRSDHFASGSGSISLLSGLSADEFTLFSGISTTDSKTYYYKNALYANVTSATPGTDLWNNIYPYVYVTNSAIEGLTNANTLTPAIQKQLLGEAKFIRALLYFYLVNLYENIPLVLTTDYSASSALSQAPKDEVYEQIIADLKDAENLLNENYLDGTLLKTSTERVRPNKWSATALLARVYLYKNDWANAETKASSVINSGMYNLSSPSTTFLKASLNNKEAIFQLQPVNTGWNTEDARVFVINQAPNNSKPVSLSQSLLNAFDSIDLRKKNWTMDTTIGGKKYFYPFKYKVAKQNDPVTEFVMVLRLAEQYLIRAEARAQQDKLIGGNSAESDINSIRQRAGLPNTTASTKTDLLAAIELERRLELFSEWGHRWFDLKRMGRADAVIGAAAIVKGGSWQTTDQLYPIPLYDIDKNPHLNQNNGYN